MLRVGIDVGGTFTDLFAWDRDSGAARTAKVLTTKHDLTQGVLSALEQAEIRRPAHRRSSRATRRAPRTPVAGPSRRASR
jgi:N-methylhydantoinase A/oxoprolinase/acetone carboxylase beta subunit